MEPFVPKQNLWLKKQKHQPKTPAHRSAKGLIDGEIKANIPMAGGPAHMNRLEALIQRRKEGITFEFFGDSRHVDLLFGVW